MQCRQNVSTRPEQACAQEEHKGPAKVSIEALAESRQNQRRDDCSKAFHVSPHIYNVSTQTVTVKRKKQSNRTEYVLDTIKWLTMRASVYILNPLAQSYQKIYDHIAQHRIKKYTLTHEDHQQAQPYTFVYIMLPYYITH